MFNGAFAATFFFFFSSIGFSKAISLNLPVFEEFPRQHKFYQDLLETSLRDMGHYPEIKNVTLSVQSAVTALQEGKISLLWLVQTDDRACLK